MILQSDKEAGSAASLECKLADNSPINDEYFTLDFAWGGPAPKAGQFFMVRPLRSGVFLARPLGAAEWKGASRTAKFLVARRGRGTEELARMRAGDECALTGPLGNAWEGFLPESGKTALVSGGAGVAPLAALVAEKQGYRFHVYAGFKNGFSGKKEEAAMLGAAVNAEKITVAAEDGKNAPKGRIVDFFDEAQGYAAVFACGPLPMLKALKAKCEKAGLPCFLSLERRLACGVGACLGCTVRTLQGNRRLCADGPVFAAEELVFDD